MKKLFNAARVRENKTSGHTAAGTLKGEIVLGDVN